MGYLQKGYTSKIIIYIIDLFEFVYILLESERPHENHKKVNNKIKSKRYKGRVEAYVCRYPHGRYVLHNREDIWPDSTIQEVNLGVILLVDNG